jgi:hypothetical protein
VIGNRKLLAAWPVENHSMAALTAPLMNFETLVMLAQGPENIIRRARPSPDISYIISLSVMAGIDAMGVGRSGVILGYRRCEATLPPTPGVFLVPGTAPATTQAELRRERILAKSCW